MTYLPSFASTAHLMADNARAMMLTALLDGKALPAGELAFASGITAQTASAHLAKLLAGGLVCVECEGRHRYYRLAGAHIAEALEHLGAIKPQADIRRRALTRDAQRLRFCRCCYDHLAGQMGVAVAESLQREGYLKPASEKRFEVTAAGGEWFASLGLDLCALKPSRRGIARQCLDWTERKHHLAGPLGVALLQRFCALGWMRRMQGSRMVEITPTGWNELRRVLDLDADGLRAACLAA